VPRAQPDAKVEGHVITARRRTAVYNTVRYLRRENNTFIESGLNPMDYAVKRCTTMCISLPQSAI